MRKSLTVGVYYSILLLFMKETFIIIDMILSKHNFTKNKQNRCTMHSHSTIVGVITMLIDGAQNNVTSFRQAGSKRDHLSAFNSVQFTIYYTFFFNIDAVVCQNNGQFQAQALVQSQKYARYVPKVPQGRTHSYYPCHFNRYFPCQHVDRTQIAY